MQRPFRFIPCNDFPFAQVNVFFTEDKLALRLLSEETNITEEEASTVAFKTKQDLLTVEKLADPRMNVCENSEIRKSTLTKIGDKFYFICSEYIFDRHDPRWQRSQAPTANFIFTISLFGDRTLRCHEKALLTNTTKWRANHYCFNESFTVPFQFYIRTPEDNLMQVSKSFTAREDTVISNLSMRDAVVQSRDTVNSDAKWSHLFQVGFVMESPVTVTPNETFTVRVIALDGMTKEICEDLNYSAFEVEAVDGYVPHKRAIMKNGIAVIKAMALGLEDGETMRIKFGRKFTTGLAECTVQIKS